LVSCVSSVVNWTQGINNVDICESKSDGATRSDGNDTVEVLQCENAELQQTVSTLLAQLQAAQQVGSQDDSIEVKELKERCVALDNENQNQLKNLMELDSQHQAAVELILKKKEQIQEEAQTLRESYNEITQLLAQTQADKQQQDEQHQTHIKHLESQCKDLKAELAGVRHEKDVTFSKLKSDMDADDLKLSELTTELNNKVDFIQKLENAVQELENGKGEAVNGRIKLEEELKIVREREQLQCSLLQDSNNHQEELLALQTKYEDVSKCNTELKATLEKTKNDLKEAREAEAEISKSYECAVANSTDAYKSVEEMNQKVASLTGQMSDLSVHIEKNKYSQEEENQKKLLEEKISSLEKTKKCLEQELQNSIQSVNDSKAMNEILESRLEANSQELNMAKTSLNELDTKLRQTDTDLITLRKAKADETEEVKKALALHNKECGDGGVGALIHVLGEAVWQRDTLEHHVASLTHQLREKTELLSEADMARSEVERECEDLRDQLEEVQKGDRPSPEGSCRGLPTIEEEESEGGETEGGAVAENGELSEEKRSRVKDTREQRNDDPRCERHDNSGEIQALQAQVEVLSEVRGNLEVEVANLRGEREGLLGQLRQAEGHTGNLANLETEAASLRGQKKSLEKQLESLTQEMDVATVTLQDERDTLRDRITSLTERIEAMQAEMTLAQHERESLGQQLLTEYAAVEEKDSTIRVLEGEIEGLKSTLREKFINSPSMRNAEDRLQKELDSVRSQIIYKEDKIDALSQNLEQFAEIFKTDYCAERTDDMFRKIKGKYTALEQSLKEKEEKILELTKLIDCMHEESESYKKQTSDTESKELFDLKKKEEELSLTKEMLEKSEMEIFQLREKLEEETGNGNCKEELMKKLSEDFNTVQQDKEATTTKLVQANEELHSLTGELSNLQCALDSEKSLVAQLQRENESLMSQKEGTAQDLSLALVEKDGLLVEKQAKISTLLSQVEKVESINAEKEKILKEKNELQKELENITLKMEEAETKRKDMENGQEATHQQVVALQGERDQMIAAITQKHQESLSYHAEIQRLTQVLSQTSQEGREEQTKLTTEVQKIEAALVEARAQVASMKEQIHALTTTNTDLKKSAAESIIHKTEMAGLHKEIDIVKGKLSSLEQERDQLRMANSQFNTQYQDQAKELSTVREREGRLSVECDRLRQHLVSVEETYTGEALKAEEREATLRSTLTKMEEKHTNHSTFYSNANQRASVQVETLQEEVRKMNAQRDDAVLRLHTAEEASHTSQQSLTTLQQVLQDFQKNQAREISEATERTRRQLEEEQARVTSLTSQLNAFKGQLNEAQGGLAAAGRLGEQLTKKEQMITALKAQVTSHEEVARRARDEVACLRTTSEGKVDKPLLRNLLVGYFATPGDKRSEVLRVIGEVLDFSGEERARTGLDTQGSSWLSSIANFLAPPASNVRVTSKVDVLDHSSLSQAFIRFLEDESSPRPQARLPAVQMAQQTTEKAEKKAQAKAQAASKINPFVSTGSATSVSDSGSRTSSPLLAAASTTPTLPTITPTVPSMTPIPTVGSAPPMETLSPISTTKYLSNLLTSDRDDENANKQEA
ncbi:hypothetical protein Pmani_007599, partial [Petrolisthes manimaculis]